MREIITKNKNFIPILILCIISVWTTYEILFTKIEISGELYDRIFSFSNVFAFSALIIDVIVYIKFRKYFKYFVFGTVFLGLLGILNYQSSILMLTIIFIPLQITSLMVAIIYGILNFNRLEVKIFGKKDPNCEYIPNLEKVDKFKRNFQQKSSEELVELINDHRFVVEAKMAANQILNERTSK